MKKQIETKRCSKCGKVRPVDEFRKSMSWCKRCCSEYHKKYRQENKERIAEYREKYRQENKERVAEYRKKYRQENKEYRKKYVTENIITINGESYNKNTVPPKMRPVIGKLIGIRNLQKELKIIREEVINLKEARNG